jgi:hypothetical protein
LHIETFVRHTKTENMKNKQPDIFHNGHQPLQQRPCTGNIAFSTGGGGAMIEFAFIIAASMRIMAEGDEGNRQPRPSCKKEPEAAGCFAC